MGIRMGEMTGLSNEKSTCLREVCWVIKKYLFVYVIHAPLPRKSKANSLGPQYLRNHRFTENCWTNTASVQPDPEDFKGCLCAQEYFFSLYQFEWHDTAAWHLVCENWNIPCQSAFGFHFQSFFFFFQFHNLFALLTPWLSRLFNKCDLHSFLYFLSLLFHQSPVNNTINLLWK